MLSDAYKTTQSEDDQGSINLYQHVVLLNQEMSPMSSASLNAHQRHNRIYVQATDQFSKQPDKQPAVF